MTEQEKNLLQQVRVDHGYIVGLRRYFHRHPELGREEYGTQQRIEQELDAIGVSHHRQADTGVVAEITGTGASNQPARTVILRADIDALPVTEENDCPYKSTIPGKMHACGHDAHTASLIGAARILSKNRDLFHGTVRLVFQPAEEIGYGGQTMVAEGVADGADRTFGIHIGSDIPVGKVVIMEGPNNASVDWFRIKVHGLGAHVSTPQHGIDAAYIASQIVVGAQALVTRRTSPMDNVLIGIGKVTAGTAYNVVAQEAELEGTVRVLTPELRRQVHEELDRLCRLTAESYGGTVETEWKNYTAPLINDAASVQEAQRVMTSLFGAENMITSRRPALSGDDMAEFINKVPGVYCYVGSRSETDPNTQVAQHNSHFDVDENSMTVQVALYTDYAVRFLEGQV